MENEQPAEDRSRLNTSIALLHTEVQAIRCCQLLSQAGIPARYEGPARAGAWPLDWNAPQAEFRVLVAAEDLERAEACVEKIDFSATAEDTTAGSEQILPDPEDLEGETWTPEELVSFEARRVRNLSILTLLLACLLPYTLYRIIRLCRMPLRGRDVVNLLIALLMVTFLVLVFLGTRGYGVYGGFRYY